MGAGLWHIGFGDEGFRWRVQGSGVLRGQGMGSRV